MCQFNSSSFKLASLECRREDYKESMESNRMPMIVCFSYLRIKATSRTELVFFKTSHPPNACSKHARYDF